MRLLSWIVPGVVVASVWTGILSVLLVILKVLLWTIVGVLGLILLILLIVLFDPFFYQAKGHKQGEEISADAKVYYLFHIIRVTVSFTEGQLYWSLCLFGKQIAGSDEVPPKDRSREARKQRREEKKSSSLETAVTAETGGKTPSSLEEAVSTGSQDASQAAMEAVRQETVTWTEDLAEYGTPTAPQTPAEGIRAEITIQADRPMPLQEDVNLTSAAPTSRVIVTDKAKADQEKLEAAMQRARRKADEKVEQERAARQKELAKQEKLLASAEKEEERQKKKQEKELQKRRKKEEKERKKQEKEEARRLKQQDPSLQEVISLSQRIDRLIDKLFDKWDDVLDLIDKVLDAPDVLEEKLAPILSYKEMWDDYPDKDKTFRAIFRVIGGVIKPLIPRGYQVDALVGTGDPFMTAKLYGIYLAVGPLLLPKQTGKQYLNLETDMMEKTIDFDAALRGRFHLGAIIGPILGAPFNRYIFRLIRFVLKLVKQKKKEQTTGTPEEAKDIIQEQTDAQEMKQMSTTEEANNENDQNNIDQEEQYNG